MKYSPSNILSPTKIRGENNSKTKKEHTHSKLNRETSVNSHLFGIIKHIEKSTDYYCYCTLEFHGILYCCCHCMSSVIYVITKIYSKLIKNFAIQTIL